MNWRLPARIGKACIILVLVGAGLPSESTVLGMAARPPVVGQPAPDFELRDLDGVPRRLADYRGQVVLLNFWATWCKPCTAEMPQIQAAYDRLKDKGFVVIAINELEDTERVRGHIVEHGHTFPVWMDHDNEVANMYGVVGLPVSVFIDRNGRVREYVKGGLLTEAGIGEAFARIADESGRQSS